MKQTFIASPISGSFSDSSFHEIRIKNKISTIGGLTNNTYITKAVFASSVTTIADNAFNGCYNLSYASGNGVLSIKNFAFHYCTALTSISFPACNTVGEAGFAATALTSISLPACNTIGYNAFGVCTNLTTVSLPACTTVISGAFHQCTALTTISLPACQTLQKDIFYQCTNLTTISLPVCIFVGGGAFYKCSNLKLVDFGPNMTQVPTLEHSNAFENTNNSYKIKVATNLYMNWVNATNWTYVSSHIIPYSPFLIMTADNNGATYLKSYNATETTTTLQYVSTATTHNVIAPYSNDTVLNSRANLQKVEDLGIINTVGASAFYSCSYLTTVSLPACTTVGSNAFRKCLRLISLYLTGSTVPVLLNSNAFISTPIKGYSTKARQYGSIFVPTSLLTAYQNATNWTHFSNRMVGI